MRQHTWRYYFSEYPLIAVDLDALSPRTPQDSNQTRTGMMWSHRMPAGFAAAITSYPVGSMYAIYGSIYHQYTPVMLAYIYHTWILWVFGPHFEIMHFNDLWSPGRSMAFHSKLTAKLTKYWKKYIETQKVSMWHCLESWLATLCFFSDPQEIWSVQPIKCVLYIILHVLNNIWQSINM